MTIRLCFLATFLIGTYGCMGSLPIGPPTATATSITPQPTPLPTPEPTPPPPITVSAQHVTGTWVETTINASPHAPVPYCWSDWAWGLTQQDGQVLGRRSLVWVPPMAVQLAPPSHIELVQGTYNDGRLALTGGIYPTGTEVPTGVPLEAVTYSLTFDPATSRLVGTRNGAPFAVVIGTPGRDVSAHPGAGMPAVCI
jgi:hypothetical protein